MKDIIFPILVLIAILIVGGVVGYSITSEAADDTDYTDCLEEELNNTPLSDNLGSDNIIANVSGNMSGNDSDIVSEEILFNSQQGEGYYREVTYSDGGFRQFDVDTGELIGSSYDSDQDKLPSME